MRSCGAYGNSHDGSKAISKSENLCLLDAKHCEATLKAVNLQILKGQRNTEKADIVVLLQERDKQGHMNILKGYSWQNTFVGYAPPPLLP